jgi:hypothetical protein
MATHSRGSGLKRAARSDGDDKQAPWREPAVTTCSLPSLLATVDYHARVRIRSVDSIDLGARVHLFVRLMRREAFLALVRFDNGSSSTAVDYRFLIELDDRDRLRASIRAVDKPRRPGRFDA